MRFARDLANRSAPWLRRYEYVIYIVTGMNEVICPKCKSTIPWWRARHYTKCEKCSTKLVMANRVSFNLFIIIGALVLTPFWVISPAVMVAAIFFEIAIFWLFAQKYLYYKTVN